MDSKQQWIALSSRELSAEINPFGAQLSVLRDRSGHDLLWDGDPAVWAGRAPLLFPIVGALAGGHYRIGSSHYALPRHGFARGKPFALIQSTASSATFRLSADEDTLKVFPFLFELDVQFDLEGPSLALTTHVRNLDTEEMPASFGLHPGFRWPLPFGQARSAHFIQFQSDEPAPIRRLDADGLLTPTLHATPVVDRRLALNDALFEDDVIIFDKVRSRSVTYGADKGPRIQLSYPDSPYLGVWTKPQGRFICIEPWHGVADPAGFNGDFYCKPGVFVVSPGGESIIKMTMALL